MKKILILMIAMFVLTFSSTVNAHNNQHNWSNPSYQMFADDAPPPPDPNAPPKQDQHKHKPKPHQPEPPKPQPEPGPNGPD